MSQNYAQNDELYYGESFRQLSDCIVSFLSSYEQFKPAGDDASVDFLAAKSFAPLFSKSKSSLVTSNHLFEESFWKLSYEQSKLIQQIEDYLLVYEYSFNEIKELITPEIENYSDTDMIPIVSYLDISEKVYDYCLNGATKSDPLWDDFWFDININTLTSIISAAIGAGTGFELGAEVGAAVGGLAGIAIGAAIGVGITAAVTNKIKGIVVDRNFNPIIGACVQAVGYTDGTITDADGQFELRIRRGGSFAVSFVGYESIVVNPDKSGYLVVVLKEDD